MFLTQNLWSIQLMSIVILLSTISVSITSLKTDNSKLDIITGNGFEILNFKQNRKNFHRKFKTMNASSKFNSNTFRDQD